MSATAEIRERLRLLAEEESLARAAGLCEHPAYLASLRADLAAARAAYVGAWVTERACARAARDGRLIG